MLADVEPREEIPGRATVSGTTLYASKFDTRFADFRGLRLARVGIGTSLSDATPDGCCYGPIVASAFRRGINVVDTAISYGAQSCERAVGTALRNVIEHKVASRDQIFVATKCGYIALRGRQKLLRRIGISADAVVGGSHCIAPAFIRDQLARSRGNLGIQTIDLYLLHNPEIQAAGLSRRQFLRRICAAFEALELASANGHIGLFGIATWNAFRTPPEDAQHLELHHLRAIASAVAGDRHHFGAIQAPYNVLCQEISTCRFQRGPRGMCSLIAAVRDEGMLLLTSAALAGGVLAKPGLLVGGPRQLESAGQRAIDFACRTPGVTCALVGMRSHTHLEDAVRALRLRRTADRAE